MARHGLGWSYASFHPPWAITLSTTLRRAPVGTSCSWWSLVWVILAKPQPCCYVLLLGWEWNKLSECFCATTKQVAPPANSGSRLLGVKDGKSGPSAGEQCPSLMTLAATYWCGCQWEFCLSKSWILDGYRNGDGPGEFACLWEPQHSPCLL